MKNTIAWLLSIERLAGAFYGEVSAGFKEDEEFSKFFRQLSGEEALHARFMERASDYLIHHAAPAFSISVDEETRRKIEFPFIKSRDLLSSGNFSREDIMDCLATTEFSEWNDIFLYTVESLKEERELMPVVAKMHDHLREIMQFMGTVPEGRKYLYIVKSLPQVWKENILIIDDDQPILEFLKSLLEDEGQIETAGDGREGLEKIKEKYFDVIISDLAMPVMDGIEFFKQSMAYDPEIRKRIIFFSGSIEGRQADFLRENKLKYLSKPAPISEIVKKVREVLHKNWPD